MPCRTAQQFADRGGKTLFRGGEKTTPSGSAAPMSVETQRKTPNVGSFGAIGPFARLHCDRRVLCRDRNPLALVFHIHAGEPHLRAHAFPVLRPFLDYASDHHRGISMHAYV